jgi:cation diffusion facilitator CzcD-associated flavoprotein CzcO
MSVDSSVIIIGGGMSGIGAAVQLVRNFNTIDFEIIEKSGDVGGTWHLNTYPGCGCDVSLQLVHPVPSQRLISSEQVASHFYSYSFALNPEWSKVFAMQPEIHKYFKSVAEDYNITSRVRCHSVVESAHWDPDTATWLVRVLDLQTNQVRNKRCNILISAVGALSIPQVCDIPEVERFRGKLFHSAEWDHSFDWKGKDVVAIGKY